MNRKLIVIIGLVFIFSISKLYSQVDAKVEVDSLRVIRIGYPAAMLSHVDSRGGRVAIELWTNQY